MKDKLGVDHDDLRKCPSCYEGQSPMVRLGERTRDDDVTVVGWRCLSCGSYVSEHVGDGKIADMVDEPPRVGEPITDGGSSESAVNSSEDLTQAVDAVERIEHQYNSELLPGVSVTYGDREYECRVQRGGVERYDTRWVDVSRDGLSFRIRPDDITPAIEALKRMRTALLSESLLTPSCKYCGSGLDSVEEAKKHHAEKHEDRAYSDGDGFDPTHYEPDPNGSIQRLRSEDGDNQESRGDCVER